MAEAEERPSKIRKLTQSNGSSDPPQSDPANFELLEEQTDLQPPPASEGDDEEREDSDVNQALLPTALPGMSKSQLKKLRRAERWEASKDYRKTLRKEKHKEKQARKAEAKAELKEKIARGEMEKPKPPPAQRFRRPTQVPISLVLDCDFDALMVDKEIVSLSAQVTRSYSDNKTSPFRTHLAVSSWGGALKTRFENVLASNHLSWKGIKFYEQDFVGVAEDLHGIMRSPSGGKLVGALAPKADLMNVNTVVQPGPAEVSQGLGTADTDKLPATTIAEALAVGVTEDSDSSPAIALPNNAILAADGVLEGSQKGDSEQKAVPSIVYLSSDSPHTLDVLSPYTTYIIGGIVDKNRYKGLCYKRACERGIPTAKLPIGEYMTMQSRTVLTVNHVVEIMLKWLDTGDWGEAFLSVIPKRKEAKLKTPKGDEQLDREEEGDGEESEGDENGGSSLNEDAIDGMPDEIVAEDESKVEQ